MAVSVFDLFKIGIGPSSSHTVGPMRAAGMFAHLLADSHRLDAVTRVKVELYGSLGATGKGHGTDMAVVLGLGGHEPDTVDVDEVPHLLDRIRTEGALLLGGTHRIGFDERLDLVFHRRETLAFHANGMRVAAFDGQGSEIEARTYYSVGGGFVVNGDDGAAGSPGKGIVADATVLPMPFHSGADLLALTARHDIGIAALMRRNERHWRTDEEIDAGLLAI